MMARSTYMKRGLAVDIGAVDVDLVVVQKCNDIVNVCVCDRVEKYVASHLLHLSNHFLLIQK